MPREKSRYRDRRSSSSSSESSYERKKKSKHKRRSRDRSESSSRRRKRSTSRSKRKRRSYSRSPSRERYEKSRRPSPSRSKRDRSHSRSSSRGRSKYKSSKKSRRRSRSSSRSSPYEGNEEDIDSDDLSSVMDSLMKLNLRNKRAPLLSTYLAKRPTSSRLSLDDTEIKLEKAIKAAAAAGLTMTKIPTYEYKEVEVKEDMPTIHDRNLLEELNSDSFVQKSFTSSAKKKEMKNIVIDLNTETITVPEVEAVKRDDESIINLDAIPDEAELVEMWIKKLYQFRKRMLKGEI